MDQNLEKRSETALTKSTISNFIHDMKELEQQQFTLNETYTKCVHQRKITDETAKRQLSEAENFYQQTTSNLNTLLKQKITKPQKVDEPPKKINKPSIYEIVGNSIFFTFLAILVLQATLKLYSLLILILLTIFFGGFIGIYISIHAKRRYKKYLENNENYHQYLVLKEKYQKQEAALAQYTLAKQNLERAKQQNNAAQIRIEKLDYMSKFLFQHISKIENQKKKLYAIGIVPPDYRKLDCLIEIDQMFRNDLVDTVREAVKIYEERVFRGELVRGIDNIYNMLGSLSASMYNIENTLYGIQREVRLMSDEISKISDSTESFQANMLSESRAARYATEALKKSQENCETYLRAQYYHI